jgi:hypothetical protein
MDSSLNDLRRPAFRFAHVPHSIGVPEDQNGAAGLARRLESSQQMVASICVSNDLDLSATFTKPSGQSPNKLIEGWLVVGRGV